MKIEIELSQDGNQVCALVGENLQEGTAGFGDTPNEALHNLIDALAEEGKIPANL